MATDNFTLFWLLQPTPAVAIDRMHNRMKITALWFVLLPLWLGAQETGTWPCADGVDNDGDGLIDCADPDCGSAATNGCAVCPDAFSFADDVLEYSAGCEANSDLAPEGALGLADAVAGANNFFALLHLGRGGSVKLVFQNNLLTNDGSPTADLLLFTVAEADRPFALALRPADAATRARLMAAGLTDADGDDFYAVGERTALAPDLDVDAALPGLAAGVLRFDGVEIRDQSTDDCTTDTPGLNLDAVCARSSLAVVDCAGQLGGTRVWDDCGACHQPNDPAYNAACRDCNDRVNGRAVRDSCGTCLEPEDPTWNEACADCAGVANGPAVVDDCGACLPPADPAFNRGCLDCAGVPRGRAVVDRCGACLLPEDAAFNRSCNLSTDLYVPTAFSPNGDGINDDFRPAAALGHDPELLEFSLYDRWGAEVYRLAGGARLSTVTAWWDGRRAGQHLPAGLYPYRLVVRFENGDVRRRAGVVGLLR